MQFENQKSAVSVCGAEWPPRSSENSQWVLCLSADSFCLGFCGRLFDNAMRAYISHFIFMVLHSSLPLREILNYV